TGTESRLEFVTQAAPYPASIPVAFTAVVFELGNTDERRGLVSRQRVLPNRSPFTDATVVFNDPTLTELAFSYLDEGGTWQSSWDTEAAKKLPRAIRISVGGTIGGRAETLPPLTASIRVGSEQGAGANAATGAGGRRSASAGSPCCSSCSSWRWSPSSAPGLGNLLGSPAAARGERSNSD